MKIRDKKEEWIEVTDLDKAIKQADSYKEYQHDPPTESDRERQAYWSDIHKKLIALKTKSAHHSPHS
ncbi:3-isopropylmalate dehydratase [Elizabethkingia anophelis]|nr:3-isopropylmalate dehydratase [Elizabethkingia anophelis]